MFELDVFVFYQGTWFDAGVPEPKSTLCVRLVCRKAQVESSAFRRDRHTRTTPRAELADQITPS